MVKPIDSMNANGGLLLFIFQDNSRMLLMCVGITFFSLANSLL